LKSAETAARFLGKFAVLAALKRTFTIDGIGSRAPLRQRYPIMGRQSAKPGRWTRWNTIKKAAVRGMR